MPHAKPSVKFIYEAYSLQSTFHWSFLFTTKVSCRATYGRRIVSRFLVYVLHTQCYLFRFLAPNSGRIFVIRNSSQFEAKSAVISCITQNFRISKQKTAKIVLTQAKSGSHSYGLWHYSAKIFIYLKISDESHGTN